jgi:enoyl-CoA hydratase/carnithine racemase
MIECRVDNGIAVLEINRPPVNSYTTELLKELDAAILDARFDDNVHAIVITGKVEKFFSAGADINMLSKQSLGFKNNFALHGHEVLMRLENTPKIVIAAINGHAVGIGLTMPLACDIRIASDRAKFSVRFVKVGLTPECGSTRYLPLVAGLGNALYMALTGRIIEADEALRRGLVDHIVSHDKLMDEAMALAEEIAANPASAVWAAKRIIHENAGETDLRRVVTREGFAIRTARGIPDHAEAVKAFLEKREPNFSK